MADKPFLTDIKTLRERARQHIEKGAVTEGYSAALQKSSASCAIDAITLWPRESMLTV